MDKWVSEKFSKFNGSILVSKENSILLNNGFGLADTENNIRNTRESKFLIGSISKMFTATAIMKLYEEKLLDINDSVNKYIEIEGLEDEIRIINLLNHTSGIKNYVMFSKKIDLFNKNRPLDIAKIMINMKRDFPSGKRFAYNNTGYLILALVIEAVTNIKFEDYIKENIFLPLEMSDSDFFIEEEFNGAKGYKNSKKSKIFHPTAFFGCGDIVSTTNDLKKFMVGLNNGRIVSKELVERMGIVSANNKFMNYGLGCIISEKIGEKVIGHGGSVPNAYSSLLSYYPERDLIIVVLSNNVTSLKPFVPGIFVGQYIERSIYEKVSDRSIGYFNRITF